MMRRIIIFVWLTLVWVALWEDIGITYLSAGVVVALIALWLVPPQEEATPMGFRPWAGVKLVSYFFWKLIEASAIVAWEVATPRNQTSPSVITVRIDTTAKGIVALLGIMLSLTPGTLTLDLQINERETKLVMHVLHYRSQEAITDEVHTLERLALAAFPVNGRGNGSPAIEERA